ncbi:MAG TPA: Gfo/Idh/MocA family oxidoreductase [Solirubrobacterales bacterium]|nr:Gfo/Idh/MocA family oxidoreductase [Solirubrobacterales bacterium]
MREAGIRVGIAGCGRIGWAHALGWSADPRCRLVAVADPRAAARDEVGELYGVPPEGRYSSYQEMLEGEELDVFSNCLWAADHLTATLAAIGAGARLVLCEKPLADDLGEARAMLDAAAAAEVKLAVGHQRRHYPGWDEAAKALAEGRIGRPLHAWTSVVGGLMSNGTHAIDMVRYLLGDPPVTEALGAVERRTDRYERGVAAEDRSLAMLVLGGELRLFLDGDSGLDAKITANATIHGEEGLLEVVEGEARLLTDAGWERLEVPPPGLRADDPRVAGALAQVGGYMPERFHLPFIATFVDQARNLLDWLLEGGDYRGDAAAGYASLEAVCAVYESVRRRAAVPLPLATRAHPLGLLIAEERLPVEFPGPYDTRDPRAFARSGEGDR